MTLPADDEWTQHPHNHTTAGDLLEGLLTLGDAGRAKQVSIGPGVRWDGVIDPDGPGGTVNLPLLGGDLHDA